VDLKGAKKPYYNLMMFPYPSAEGLHVGNVYAFTGSDIHGRFRRMQGKDVFEPIGFDSFGIHSENFAIQQGTHPKTQTEKNIKNFRKQLKQMGALFDWDHEVITSEPNYYKWTQWLFLQLYKAGLAYRAKAPVDWCPSCKTVLANEQVINGHCERCETTVVQKELEQWFFRITKYAEKLLKNLNWIDWSERTKIAQKNWIGKSHGAQIYFPIKNSKLKIEVFTTRPDTLFGTTYMVLAPEHPFVDELEDRITNWAEVRKYRTKAKRKNELERVELSKEKTGVELKGIKAINPVNKEELPIFIADYVLMSYGTGAIMAVPAHDERDFEFAKTFKLKITPVISPVDIATGEHFRLVGKTPDEDPQKILKEILEGQRCYEGRGVLINSAKFTGMDTEKAKWEITKFAKGKKVTRFHLRDWLISRQRYWGPPIPIIYCKECGIVPVPEKDLPVLLPNIKNFRPTGTSKAPLASVERFVNTKCPQCKKPAKRETDVSDTFLDSAWYFLRYPSVGAKNSTLKIKNSKLEIPWNREITRRWLPIDMYIGGQEHAVLHLMYTRFTTMVLNDLGYIDFAEPFIKFRAHGLVIKDGAKMSKSRGNVVNPDEYFTKYGADTVRMYLMFIGPFTEGGDWSDKSIIGIHRFLNRIWNFQFSIFNFQKTTKSKNSKDTLESLRHRTIKKVTEDMEKLRYNTAIAALMEYFNAMSDVKGQMSGVHTETLLVLLAPFAPHITEELWKNIGQKDSVHNQPWPTYSTKLAKEAKIRLVLQVNGKVRDIVEVSSGISNKEAEKLALESEKVQKWVKGKKEKKIIVVPGKLVNIVV